MVELLHCLEILAVVFNPVGNLKPFSAELWFLGPCSMWIVVSFKATVLLSERCLHPDNCHPLSSPCCFVALSRGQC